MISKMAMSGNFQNLFLKNANPQIEVCQLSSIIPIMIIITTTVTTIIMWNKSKEKSQTINKEGEQIT